MNGLNIESVKNSYKAIIQALEEEIENEDGREVNEAFGILTNLKSGRFIVYLFILHELWCQVEIFAKDNKISIQTPFKECKRKRQEPHNLKHFDTTATTTTAVDQFLQLNFEESLFFVDYYKDFMNVSKDDYSQK
ncbi:Hypothetical protein CINCED_3A010134 [Cinara cedri]|uniref:Uncharacterized protein n=1 Tax=Cinara cedri TaxID=506608 RepID=A0A5E4N8E4_9HEMI|nr:Hypothetical protein CINCED_3A010134 [Cinara cedri]